jgi:hypothetical protein
MNAGQNRPWTTASQQVLPERLGLLPEVHQRSEDPQTVDRTAASGGARVAAVAHHHPSLSDTAKGDAGTAGSATPPRRAPRL